MQSNKAIFGIVVDFFDFFYYIYITIKILWSNKRSVLEAGLNLVDKIVF